LNLIYLNKKKHTIFQEIWWKIINKIMKKLTIIILLALAGSHSIKAKNREYSADSLQINIDKRTKSVVESEHFKPQGYSLLSDLKSLFKAKNMELTDDLWQSIKEIVNSESKKDTVLNINQGGKQIAVAFNMSESAKARSQTTDGPERSADDNEMPQKNRNKADGAPVKINKDGIHITDGNDEVHITGRGVKVIENGKEEVNIGYGDDDSTATKKWVNKHEFGSLSGFNIYLGLNNFNDAGSKLYKADDYALKTFGSRYFSMGWTKSTNITNGPNARLKLALGFNFSWYNFMLENNSIWKKGASAIEIVPVVESLKKSKLTASYLEVPLIPYLAFKKGKFIEYIGFGGYGSYRLGSHTKTKSSAKGKKEHEYNNFYLTDFRYGLSFQVGINNFAKLFVNYDLNPLFKADKGPKLNAISFGLRL
jgi:Outer membrane protein beta-barrel domain